MTRLPRYRASSRFHPPMMLWNRRCGGLPRIARKTRVNAPMPQQGHFRTMAKTSKKPSARASKQPARRAKPPSKAPRRAKISPALVAAHGLTPEEYQRILALVGREPSITELGIFSAMWNEHCSYKSSKIHLRTLPTKAPWVIQGPGENAGVIDIGDGLAVVFKMESHNHPSYIEPYQGAAT